MLKTKIRISNHAELEKRLLKMSFDHWFHRLSSDNPEIRKRALIMVRRVTFELEGFENFVFLQKKAMEMIRESKIIVSQKDKNPIIGRGIPKSQKNRMEDLQAKMEKLKLRITILGNLG